VPASKSSLKKLPAEPEELLDEEELLEELELEDEELLEELLLAAPLDEEELELEELELELLLEEELELEELELELLLEELLLDVPSSPAQVGVTKVPSWEPWKPNTLLAVAPGAGNCQLNSFVNLNDVPQAGLVGSRITFQSFVQQTCSGHVTVTVQPLNAVVPVLLTLTSTWKKVPPVLEGVAVQLYAANACPFENRPSNRPDSSMPNLM
jgi:hypothetical protein